jgi:polyhydroxyalkanoate synthesis regulator phasin
MAGREDLRSMQDAWRAYLDLALGLTETSRKRATKVAKKLVGRGGATAEQLQTMAEDLLKTSLANREAMTRLIHFELDRALGKVGLATTDEVAELTSRVRELEEELAEARSAVTAAPAAGIPVPVPAAPAVKAVRKMAKKAAAKKASPLGTPATPPVEPATKVTTRVRKAAAGDTVVKVTPSRVVAKKAGSEVVPTPARKAVAKKAMVKKTTVAKKTAPVKKTTPGGIVDGLTQGEA